MVLRADNKQMGPVSSAELKRLATSGEIRPDDLVWREGMTEWAAARNVRGLFEEEGGANASSAAGDSGSNVENIAELALKLRISSAATSGRHPFDTLLDKYRPHFNAHFIEATAKIFRACGSYGLLAAMAVTAVFAIGMAFQINSLDAKFADGTTWLGTLRWGIVLLLVLLALQYAAGKCFGAIDQLSRAAGGALVVGRADCLAVLSKFAGVAVLLASVAMAIETSHYEWIVSGVAAFFVFAYLAVVALNPATLNISIAPELIAGEEAIGVLMFLLKALFAVDARRLRGRRGLWHTLDGPCLLRSVCRRNVAHGVVGDCRRSPSYSDSLGRSAIRRVPLVSFRQPRAQLVAVVVEFAGQARRAGAEERR